MSAVAPPFGHRSHRHSLSSPIPSGPLLYVFETPNSLQIHKQWRNSYSQILRPCSSRSRVSNVVLNAIASSRIKNQGTYDPELRVVLELATNSELFELESILFGPSYFSPLLKSISTGAEFDHFMIEEDIEERENFIEALESRFFYLAADARSTLRGWRPSYRNVLLSVRKQLNILCSTKLSTEDLEVEIFVYLVQAFSSELKEQAAVAAARVGAEELSSVLLKGGQVLTLLKIFELLVRRLSGKMLLEAAKHQINKDFLKKGAQLTATNAQRRFASFAAEKGFARVLSRYLGFRSLTTFLGPIFWGTFLADIVIQMLGTDYARILQAIYAFARIRILHTYSSQVQEDRN